LALLTSLLAAQLVSLPLQPFNEGVKVFQSQLLVELFDFELCQAVDGAECPFRRPPQHARLTGKLEKISRFFQ